MFMHAMLKYDTYLYYLPLVSTLLALIMVWILVEMLRPAVLGLVLLNLIDDSWINSMEVAIHPLRCGSAVVLRYQGLSKVRCGGEGSVLDGVWQVLESTCATTCPVWNGLLNKLVHSVSCIAGGLQG
jgi:hypothetical protein